MHGLSRHASGEGPRSCGRGGICFGADSLFCWFITVTGLPQFRGARCTSVVWAPLGPSWEQTSLLITAARGGFSRAEGAELSHGHFIKRFILLQMLLPPVRLHAPWQLCWWKGPLPAGGSPGREPHLCPLPFWWIPGWALPLQPPAPQVHTSGLLHHCHMPEPVGGPQRVWEVGLLHLGHHQIREDPQGTLAGTITSDLPRLRTLLCQPAVPATLPRTVPIHVGTRGGCGSSHQMIKAWATWQGRGLQRWIRGAPSAQLPEGSAAGGSPATSWGAAAWGIGTAPSTALPGQPSPLSTRRLLLQGSLS